MSHKKIYNFEKLMVGHTYTIYVTNSACNELHKRVHSKPFKCTENKRWGLGSSITLLHKKELVIIYSDWSEGKVVIGHQASEKDKVKCDLELKPESRNEANGLYFCEVPKVSYNPFRRFGTHKKNSLRPGSRTWQFES